MPHRAARLVIASVAFAAALIATRVVVTESLLFFFLLWNLFLALVPLALSRHLARLARPSALALGVGAVWLLFFPNAPYLLTDLIHAHRGEAAPLWYDLVLLLAAAWSGVLIGTVTLADVHGAVARWYGSRVGWGVALGALVLGSFGVYLGRFLRWNSWDVLTQPRSLLADVIAPVLDPLGHTQAVGTTVLFSVLLTLCYLALRPLVQVPTSTQRETPPDARSGGVSRSGPGC
ncbi:MAG: DUF1361 domain-containing protein [Bacteroidota bacterium]